MLQNTSRNMQTTNRTPDHTTAFAVRSFIDAAVAKTGLSISELGERLDYKTLPRIRAGEFPLPAAKRRHIEDLIRLAELEHAAAESIRLREEPAPVIPAELASMSFPQLTTALCEMLRAFTTVQPVFRAGVRAQITAAMAAWQRAADNQRAPVVYGTSKKEHHPVS